MTAWPPHGVTIHGDRGQNELAADLGLSSSTSTALVDRMEAQGIADRLTERSAEAAHDATFVPR